MRLAAILTAMFALAGCLQAREVRDTLVTRHNDRIILTYNLSSDGNTITLDPSRKPVIFPSNSLREACDCDVDRLKVVVFDRVGDYGNVRWKGLTPSSFTVPAGLHHTVSDGFYILGECAPITFVGSLGSGSKISMPVYIAVYEKKKKKQSNYRIVASTTRPLTVTSRQLQASRSVRSAQRAGEPEWREERIAIESTEEISADNSDITSALSSIEMVRELVNSETEYPFSETLRGELANLRMLKNQTSDPEIVAKINEVLKLGTERERELKSLQESDAAAAAAADKAEQQAMMEQQKAEAEAQQRDAEEKARKQEEKQQKRTLWMIIGGVVLGILGFVGNGIFKHFRDVKSQKNIMQMQESLTRQAQNEATRRSREIVRNRAHQAVNKGRAKIRSQVQQTTIKSKTKKDTKRRSI